MAIATAALRRWAWIHKWTSLVCTAFLLLLCLTGLPLVFHHELSDLLSDDPRHAALPPDTALVDLDMLAADARQRHPDRVVWFVFVDDDEPQVVVGLLPSPSASPAEVLRLTFDARTGQLLKEIAPMAGRPPGFLELMLRLHKDLFAGLAGELLLGAMGLLFVAAIVSGLVLYAPFAGKLAFGEIRRRRGRRVRWLDLHNLLGVVTVAWALVVGVTGALNELSHPLFQLWQRTDVQAMLQPYRGQPTPRPDELSSVQGAFDTVRRALPDMTVTSVIFPAERPFATPYHYLVWTKGASALTARLFTPVLVDARTGAVAAMVAMPWYLRALQVSRPLHFGDYGGLPLKIIWALLDLVTIAVLVSGLYLWLSRRRSPIETRLAELEAAE
jgi:uncharacterized iron-regulated membrane protein